MINLAMLESGMMLSNDEATQTEILIMKTRNIRSGLSRELNIRSSTTRFGVGLLFFSIPGVVVVPLLDPGLSSGIPLGSGFVR